MNTEQIQHKLYISGLVYYTKTDARYSCLLFPDWSTSSNCYNQSLFLFIFMGPGQPPLLAELCVKKANI